MREDGINNYHVEWLGLTLEHVIGKRLPEVIGDELFAIVEPYVSECLAGKPVEFEVEVPHRSGELQFLHCRFQPEWRDGKVVGLVSAGTNIPPSNAPSNVSVPVRSHSVSSLRIRSGFSR
jgi:PAS domain-containing protein